ncbi:hypothetical protein DFH29DRAFT_1009906 [Suillus ampliporus]|nr:hypothetical protein DFH29DRAFT_1009906 [Suillus ampliporus]
MPLRLFSVVLKCVFSEKYSLSDIDDKPLCLWDYPFAIQVLPRLHHPNRVKLTTQVWDGREVAAPVSPTNGRTPPKPPNHLCVMVEILLSITLISPFPRGQKIQKNEANR